MEQKIEQKAALQPTSFRLSDEVVSKFKEFANESGFNQSDALAALLNVAELNSAKSMITDRAREIEGFQVKVNDLVGMFTNSLLLNQTSEQRIREELADEIIKKELVNTNLISQIAELKDKVESAKQIEDRLIVESKIKEDELSATMKETERAVSEANKLSKVLEDYQSQLADQKAEIMELRKLEETNNRIVVEIAEAQKRLNEETRTIKALEGELKNAHNQIEFFRNELAAAKEEYKAEIQNIRAQHKSELIIAKEDARKEAAEIKAESKSAMEEQQAKYQSEIRDLKESFENLEKAIKAEYKGEIADIKSQHNDEIRSLREQHIEETKELKAEISAAKKK